MTTSGKADGLFALGVMFVMPQHRLEVSLTLGLAGLIVLVGVITSRRHERASLLAKVETV
jgi:hypothetical protein